MCLLLLIVSINLIQRVWNANTNANNIHSTAVSIGCFQLWFLVLLQSISILGRKFDYWLCSFDFVVFNCDRFRSFSSSQSISSSNSFSILGLICLISGFCCLMCAFWLLGFCFQTWKSQDNKEVPLDFGYKKTIEVVNFFYLLCCCCCYCFAKGGNTIEKS